jgi:hypothetical protein
MPVYAPTPPPPAAPVSPSGIIGNVKLMIFGGTDHKVYLGCLNCSQVALDSVLNPVGEHGSPVAQESIFNVVSPYGSVVSPESACNVVASDPPVIVDQNGRYYGRLTLNVVAPEIGIGPQFFGWLRRDVCR